jgi:hypothetical protein
VGELIIKLKDGGVLVAQESKVHASVERDRVLLPVKAQNQ